MWESWLYYSYFILDVSFNISTISYFCETCLVISIFISYLIMTVGSHHSINEITKYFNEWINYTFVK